MKTSFTNTDGTYPSVESKNSTTGTSKDGTPINKDLVDEFFGSMQAIVSKGNITPSGLSEVFDNSDIVEGIRNIAGSPGEIVYKANTDMVDAYVNGERLLFLDGSTVLVTNYPDLVNRVYCGDSDNPTANGFYKCDNSDGTNRSTSGVYFFIPDYRGYFIRCAGHGDSVDPAGPTRDLHSEQLDSIKEHSHLIQTFSYEGVLSYFNMLSGSDIGIELVIGTGDVYANDFFDTSESNAYETRPINKNVYAYVRY